MKLQQNLVYYSILIASFCLSACGDEISDSCSLTEHSCQADSKTLDVNKCICVDGSTQTTCELTEAYCQSINKTLDADKCVCVEDSTQTTCELTETYCQSINKTLDADKCVCVEDSTQTICELTEAYCQSTNMTLDADKCTCTCKNGFLQEDKCIPCEEVEGYLSCGGQCVYVEADDNNCGSCNHPCNPGTTCSNGKCIGSTYCSDDYYDISSSIDHCGECGNRCPDGETCIQGKCLISYGKAYCGNEVALIGDIDRCGGCDDKCAQGLICNTNKCFAGQGKMYCNNTIINSTTDSAHCGGCNKKCAEGLQCISSSCQKYALAEDSTIICDNTTIHPYTDSSNCGGCDIKCSNNQICLKGACRSQFLTFGHYEQDGDTTNGKEPITWRVLDTNDAGQYLFISEKALDVKAFNSENAEITWEKSTIRSWLNGYDASYNTVGTNFSSDNFIAAAFTAEEQAKIVALNVPAHANPEVSTDPGNNTTDKIFLLSITEANTYFTSDAERQADATRYTINKGAYVKGSESGKFSNDGKCADTHCYIQWGLRSPGSQNRAAHVNTDGSTSYYGLDVNAGGVGVRPALWVDLYL